MTKIIDPRNSRGNTMRDWTTAFACVQECAADAADNSEIKRGVDDNIKMLRARVKENADPQAKKLLETQELVKAQMFQHRPEMHKALMDLWRVVVRDLLSYEWDLAEEVHYAEKTKGGPLWFWQGDKDDRGETGKVTVERAKAVLIIKFLKFVAANANNQDPIEYTKQMLMKQGINEHNFHAYADSIAFPNPWTAK